jgi:hypothetical protein
MNRRFDCPAFLRHSETGQIASKKTYTAAQSASVSKISATPQPLRPLRFQKRTFTAHIITQFDTFNRT